MFKKTFRLAFAGYHEGWMDTDRWDDDTSVECRFLGKECLIEGDPRLRKHAYVSVLSVYVGTKLCMYIFS